MEEQIKALIEKYEKIIESLTERRETGQFNTSYMTGRITGFEAAVSDLKKLFEPPF